MSMIFFPALTVEMPTSIDYFVCFMSNLVMLIFQSYPSRAFSIILLSYYILGSKVSSKMDDRIQRRDAASLIFTCSLDILHYDNL